MLELDDALLDRIRAGDDAALDLLLDRHAPQLYRFAFRLSGSKEAAEEVVQDVFLRLYQHPPAPREDGPADLGSWLRVVAARLVSNLRRGERRRAGRDEAAGRLERGGHQSGLLAADPVDLVERAEERHQVRRALSRLGERPRLLLLLRHSGYRYGEIAQVLGVSPTSIGTLLVRAERDFRRAYEEVTR